MNNTTSIADGIPYLRNADIVLLIGCFGFCAILTMLVIGHRKQHDEDSEGDFEETNVQLPVFLRWNKADSDADFSFE